MTKNDIISMASDADISNNGEDLSFWDVEELQRFAAVVAAAEREACAKICDARYMGDNNREDMEAKRCAAAIRARSIT